MLLGGPSCPRPGQPHHSTTVGIAVGMASAGIAVVAVADVTLLMWASPPWCPCCGITAVASLLRALPPWHHCHGTAAMFIAPVGCCGHYHGYHHCGITAVGYCCCGFNLRGHRLPWACHHV